MTKRAWVMVLGDVGRSPRMQYHASSLCKTVSGSRLPAPLPACRRPPAACCRCLPPACRRPAAAKPTLCLPCSALPPNTSQPGYEVVLIGYRGAALVEELRGPVADGRLRLAYLPDL